MSCLETLTSYGDGPSVNVMIFITEIILLGQQQQQPEKEAVKVSHNCILKWLLHQRYKNINKRLKELPFFSGDEMCGVFLAAIVLRVLKFNG